MSDRRTIPDTSPNALSTIRKIGYVLCGLTFLLIVWGGHVNTTKSGMAFPDWPTSNAAPMVTYSPSQWLMEGDKFWEHGHRLFASLVGLVTTVLMVVAYRAVPRDRRPNRIIAGFMVVILGIVVTAIFGFNNMPGGFMEAFMAVLAIAAIGFLVKSTRVNGVDRILWLSLAAFSLVSLQGAFGGYTVRNNLPDWTSTTHGMLAEIFFMVVIGITFLAHRATRSHTPLSALRPPLSTLRPPASALRSPLSGLRSLVSVTWGLTFIQFFLGALTRHTDAWAVSATWPQWSSEGFFPASHLFQYSQVLIHFVHRTLAYIVAGMVVWQWVAVARAFKGTASSLKKSSMLAGIIVFVQILLGAAILWTGRGEIVTTLHVMIGVGLLVLNTISLYIISAEAPSNASEHAAEIRAVAKEGVR